MRTSMLLETPSHYHLDETQSILESPGHIALLACIVQGWRRTRALRLAYGYDPTCTSDPMNPEQYTQEQETGKAL